MLATKLDRNPDTNRFDAASMRRSLETSLAALGVDRVGLLHLHDPEYAADLDEVTKPGGGIAELYKMKEEGLCDAVGLAAGRVDVMMPILERFDFDAMITHNRFTLVNRNAEAMIDYAAGKGIAVINAAPFAGGVFAKGSAASPRYVYQEANEAMLQPVRAVEAICARHGVPPGAVALQFSMRDPRITSTICGVGRPEEVTGVAEWANWPIPAGLVGRDRGASCEPRRSGGDAELRRAELDASGQRPERTIRSIARGGLPERVAIFCSCSSMKVRAGSSPSRPSRSALGTLRFEARLPSS